MSANPTDEIRVVAYSPEEAPLQMQEAGVAPYCANRNAKNHGPDTTPTVIAIKTVFRAGKDQTIRRAMCKVCAEKKGYSVG